MLQFVEKCHQFILEGHKQGWKDIRNPKVFDLIGKHGKIMIFYSKFAFYYSIRIEFVIFA